MNIDDEAPWDPPPGLAADLAVARERSGSHDVEAGAARFLSVIAAGAAAPAPPAAAPISLTWWGIASVGIAGVALLAYLGSAAPTKPQPARVATTAAAVTTPIAVSAPPIEIAAVSVNSLPTATDVAPAPLAKPAPSAAPISEIDRVRAEVDQAAAARALLATNPDGALQAAEEGHRRFASGLLYPEREAIAIEALTRLGRYPEARSRGAAFLRRTPQGPLAERVHELISP